MENNLQLLAHSVSEVQFLQSKLGLPSVFVRSVLLETAVETCLERTGESWNNVRLCWEKLLCVGCLQGVIIKITLAVSQ